MKKIRERKQQKYFPIVGQKFGKMTLIEILKPSEGINFTRYLCTCDCGVTKFAKVDRLFSGRVISCGCESKNRAVKMGQNNRLKEGNSVENSIICGYKYAAKKRNIAFSLTKEECHDLFISNCHYCDRPPHRTALYDNCIEEFTFNGIDRVNNNLGYHKDNTVSCCTTCNKAKNNMTLAQFIDWIKKLYTNLIITNKGEFIP